jgi:hypothetical protein
LTISEKTKPILYKWFDYIGAAIVILQGVFVTISNMSSISENFWAGLVNITVGLVIVAFKAIFRMRGYWYFWLIGAIFTFFLGLNFSLTNTETSVKAPPAAVTISKIETETPDKIPSYVKRAADSLDSMQTAYNTLNNTRSGISGQERTNGKAMDESLTLAEDRLTAAKSEYEKQRAIWAQTIEQADAYIMQAEHGALSVFGRIVNFLSKTDNVGARWIAFFFWIFGYTIIELIEFVVFDPRVKKGSTRELLHIAENDEVENWVWSNWAGKSGRIISFESFNKFWNAAGRGGFSEETYKKIKQAAIDSGVISPGDEIIITDQTEAQRIIETALDK